MTIPPNIGWENVSVRAAGGTQTQTLAHRFGAHVVNVREYGAIGNDTANDAPAINAAAAAAFPSFSDPTQNKILYFPKGKYKIHTPIYIRNVNGGLILGDGPGATEINFGMDWFPFPGNPYTGDGLTPMILCENVTYSRIEGIKIVGPNYYANAEVTPGPEALVGLYFFCSGGRSCDHNMISDVPTAYFSVGIKLGGSGSDQKVRFSVIRNCPGSYMLLSVVRVESAASVGHIIIMGGAEASGYRSYSSGVLEKYSTYVAGTTVGNAPGNYTALNGQIAAMFGQSFSITAIGMFNASKYPMCIFGTRDEANAYYQTSVVSTNSPADGGPGGPVLVSSYICTASTTEYYQGDVIPEPPTGLGHIPPGRPQTNFHDAFDYGRILSTTCNIGFNAYNTGAAPEWGAVGRVDGTSSIVIDTMNVVSYDDTGTRGSAGFSLFTQELVVGFEGSGYVYLYGLSLTNKSGTYQTAGWWPVMNFTGTFVEITDSPRTFDSPVGGSRGLPPPSAPFKGCRFTLNDAAVVASGNFWTAPVTGGGSDVVPIFCDGTTNRIA